MRKVWTADFYLQLERIFTILIMTICYIEEFESIKYCQHQYIYAVLPAGWLNHVCNVTYSSYFNPLEN